MTIRIRCSFAIIISIILSDDRPQAVWEFLQSGNGVLTKAYSKLYYKGGGWYVISGYAADGSDVSKMVNIIKERRS